MILYMISYGKITWMLCLFSFPAYMAYNVGYLIPSSQAPASPSLSIEEPGPDSDSSAPSSSILRSVEKICFQGLQVLQMAFTGMCPKYSEILLLVVCTISQTLAIIRVNMAVTVLRSLVAEALGPPPGHWQKQDTSGFLPTYDVVRQTYDIV